MFNWRWNREDEKEIRENISNWCLVGEGEEKKLVGLIIFHPTHQNKISPNRKENCKQRVTISSLPTHAYFFLSSESSFSFFILCLCFFLSSPLLLFFFFFPFSLFAFDCFYFFFFPLFFLCLSFSASFIAKNKKRASHWIWIWMCLDIYVYIYDEDNFLLISMVVPKRDDRPQKGWPTTPKGMANPWADWLGNPQS